MIATRRRYKNPATPAFGNKPTPGAAPKQPEHRVGETKTVGGVTYRLNQNHRWELASHNDPEQAHGAQPIEPGDVDRAQQAVEADHKQRAAFVSKQLGQVNKNVAGLMRAMQAAPEFQRGAEYATKQIHPKQAGALYSYLQQNAGQQVSGGEVRDLGNGNFGFSSAAGAIVVSAPGADGRHQVHYTAKTGVVDRAMQGQAGGQQQVNADQLGANASPPAQVGLPQSRPPSLPDSGQDTNRSPVSQDGPVLVHESDDASQLRIAADSARADYENAIADWEKAAKNAESGGKAGWFKENGKWVKKTIPTVADRKQLAQHRSKVASLRTIWKDRQSVVDQHGKRQAAAAKQAAKGKAADAAGDATPDERELMQKTGLSLAQARRMMQPPTPPKPRQKKHSPAVQKALQTAAAALGVTLGGQAASPPEVKADTVAAAPQSQQKPLARAWKAGNTQGSVEFEDDEHRDLHDLGAKLRRQATARNFGSTDRASLASLTQSLSQRLKKSPAELSAIASDVYKSSKDQARGIGEGEHRKLRRPDIGGPIPERKRDWVPDKERWKQDIPQHLELHGLQNHPDNLAAIQRAVDDGHITDHDQLKRVLARAKKLHDRSGRVVDQEGNVVRDTPALKESLRRRRERSEKGPRKNFEEHVKQAANDFGMDEELIRNIVDQVWGEKKKFYDARESAKSHARKMLGVNRGTMNKLERQNKDDLVDEDGEVARELAREYPELGMPHPDHYGGSDFDYSGAMQELLKEGPQPPPSNTSPEFWQEVSDFIHGQDSGSAETSITPEERERLDSVPFSKWGRDYRKLLYARARAKSSPGQRGMFGGDDGGGGAVPGAVLRPRQRSIGWNEEDHPRVEAGQEGGGQFTEKDAIEAAVAVEQHPVLAQHVDEKAEERQLDQEKHGQLLKFGYTFEGQRGDTGYYRTEDGKQIVRMGPDGIPRFESFAKPWDAMGKMVVLGEKQVQKLPEPSGAEAGEVSGSPSVETPSAPVDLLGQPVKPPPAPKQEFGSTAGKQEMLFGTSGAAGQMNIFADKDVPDDLVGKEGREAEAKESGQSAASPEPVVPETPEPENDSDEAAPPADETPREAAERATKKAIDDDYAYARASDVRNAGEDLLGSARHKVNAWRSLQEAEEAGTAEELVTRANLLRNEPHNLVSLAHKNPLTALAMHHAIKAFPPEPGFGNARRRSRETGETKKTDRANYLDAFRELKGKAEQYAETESDPRKALQAMADDTAKIIKRLRMDGAKGYDNTANALVDTYRNLRDNGRRSTSPLAKTMLFVQSVGEKYGTDPAASRDHIGKHAQDIIEGKSLPESFGKKSKAKERFDPAKAYVETATRKGGRDVSAVTSDPNVATKHLVDNFKFRGIQWGNYVTDDERKHHAGKIVEAVADLADVVGLKPTDVALDGRLGMAIGARGKGGASAHYEPGTQVINITRASGVGTISHEWGHAFDHMLNEYKNTQSGGSYMSKEGHWGTHEIYRPENPDDAHTVSHDTKPSKGWLKREKADAGIRKAYGELYEAQRAFRSRLTKALQRYVNDGFISEKKANEYWNSNHEIFARTFETYVQHKLQSEGRENTYLSGLAGGDSEDNLWPNPGEVKQMAPAFDRIFAEFRKKKFGSEEPQRYSRRRDAYLKKLQIEAQGGANY